MSRAADIQHLIENHQRRLQKLREDQALTGYHTAPHVRTEIEDIEATLAELRAELAQLRSESPTIDPRLLRDHYFISYAPTDGADLAAALHRALAEAGLPTWLDQVHLNPAAAPERQITEALQTCAGLLLLVSADSGDETAGCGGEWAQALRYKRPLCLLRLDPAADIPFRLTGYPLLELTAAARRGQGDAFAAAVAQVHRQVADLATPAGMGQQVRARLATAQADLRLAREPHQRERILADMAELKKELAVVERIAADPAAAIERTRQSIAAGIERERQPAERPARLGRSKFINRPPLEVPGYFQDRFDETKLLRDFLTAPELRLLTVIGRGGIGKTALVARLLKHLEQGELPDGIGRLAVDGIVYLSDVGTRPLTFPNLFGDVSKLLPAAAESELTALYRDPQTTPAAKLAALLSHFDGREGQPVIVLLDNFETRLDPADHHPADPELDEALRALLTAPPHRLKVIITSRVPPRELLLTAPHYQQQIFLDAGLASPHAEALLRARDPDGKLGLQAASDAALAPAVRHTRGYPRALEALAAALAADRDTGLAELLDTAETALPDNVVEVLVGEAYSRLAPAAQQVLQALAVYGRPVPLTAVDYLLEPTQPAVDSGPTLKRLVNMNFVSKEGGLYYLHPVDRAHALAHLPQTAASPGDGPPGPPKGGVEKNLPPLGGLGGPTAVPPYTRLPVDEADNHQSEIVNRKSKIVNRQFLCRRAADYFKTTRKARAEWKTLAGLAPQLAEFDLRCEAGDFDAAARVLTEIDFDYLLLWGHYRLMLDCHRRLQGKIEDATLKQISAGNLGMAYYSLGQVAQAIVCYETALASAHAQKNKWSEGAWLGNLGIAYAALGETRRAIEYHEQGLVISREIGDRRGEGNHLGSLGLAYADLGETRRAIEYHEQALVIAREIGDRRGEGNRLGNLGNAYAALGETRRAIDYYEQALVIARDIGDRRGEGIDLGNLAEQLIEAEHYAEAIERAEAYVQICNEINKPASYAYSRIALAHLCTGDLPAARAAVEAARRYDVPQNNHNVAALLGLAALRQGEIAPARAAFREAIALADGLLAKTPQYFDALYAQGLAWAGLALSRGEEKEAIAHALTAYRAALALNADAGTVARQRRLFAALAAADSAGVLASVAAVWE